MSELQKIKTQIVTELHGLCAHCATDPSRDHHCPVQEISARIEALRGVPLMVGGQFKGVLFPRI